MGVKTFFFDTYAFHEIINKNPNYKNYICEIAIVTTRLNLMELYYGLFLKYDKKTADEYYNKLLYYVIDLDDDTIKEAMVFRASNKNKKMSYVDCIGYILSIKRNIKFLTGDEAFKSLPNVEFIK